MSEVERDFEFVAESRENAAAVARLANQNLLSAHAEFDALAARLTLDANAREHLERKAAEWLALATEQLRLYAVDMDAWKEMLETIDPEQPEHVGLTLALAEMVEAAGASLKVQSALLKLVHEAERKLAS